MTEKTNDIWGLDEIEAANMRAIRSQGPMSAGRFNELYLIGTPVTAYPDGRNGRAARTRTSSAAFGALGETPEVLVEGHETPIAITNIDPR